MSKIRKSYFYIYDQMWLLEIKSGKLGKTPLKIRKKSDFKKIYKMSYSKKRLIQKITLKK